MGTQLGENLSWIQLKSLGLSVTRDSLLETFLGFSHVLKGSIWNHCVKQQVIRISSPLRESDKSSRVEREGRLPCLFPPLLFSRRSECRDCLDSRTRVPHLSHMT